MHGIIFLTSVGAGPHACPTNGQPQGVAPTISLPDIVHRFKSLTTAHYRHNVIKGIWPPFDKRFWQRNYFEHIIRNEKELNNIRQYIIYNPLKWAWDRENPDSINFDLDLEKYFEEVFEKSKQK